VPEAARRIGIGGACCNCNHSSVIPDSAYRADIPETEYPAIIDTIRASGQLGPVLKRLRKDKGYSQFELGNRIGLSQERISVIENHPERISIDPLLTVLMARGPELRVEPRNSLDAKTPAKKVRHHKVRENAA